MTGARSRLPPHPYFLVSAVFHYLGPALSGGGVFVRARATVWLSRGRARARAGGGGGEGPPGRGRAGGGGGAAPPQRLRSGAGRSGRGPAQRGQDHRGGRGPGVLPG